MTDQAFVSSSPYIFDGERVTLRAGKDPADRMNMVEGDMRYIASLDPGSAQDPSGFVIIEDRRLPVWHNNRQELLPRERTCVFAERLTKWRYTEVIEYVASIMARPNMHGRTRLVIDASGVGAGVAAMLSAAKIKHTAIVMTAGASVTKKSSHEWSASKNLLITELAAALEHGTLKIANDLATRDMLLAELASFSTKMSASGNLVIDAGGDGHHADAATALALAWFASERTIGGFMREGKLENFW